MDERTMIFTARKEEFSQKRETLKDIYKALKEKGYDPANQILGYLLSEDPTYITTHRNARRLIRAMDRDDLLREMILLYVGEEDPKANR